MDLERREGESLMDYHKRLIYGKLIDKTLADADYSEIAEKIYGKQYSSDVARRMLYGSRNTLVLMENEHYSPADESRLSEINTRIIELEKEKIKFRDERNEYNKLIRQEARKESYMEQIIRAIYDAADKSKLDYDYAVPEITSDSSMIISLTDLHVGSDIKNAWNEYNSDVLRDRMNHYLGRIIEIQNRHNASDAYVVISEALSGLIHPNLRIQNNQDLIEQFLTAVNYIADFLVVLGEHFTHVNVYVAPGNHSRISPKKEESLTHENMDNLIIPFLSAKLQNFENINFFENDIEQSMALFTVRGINVCAVHGDKDSFSSIATTINKFLKARIDLCLLGHRHTNAMKTDGDIKVVQSGCMSGSDEYALNARYRNRPEQAICIITENEGLDCIYDVKF